MNYEILNSFDYPIIITDDNNNIIFSNTKFTETFSDDLSNIIVKNIKIKNSSISFNGSLFEIDYKNIDAKKILISFKEHKINQIDSDFFNLIENMNFGFAYHKMIYNENGEPEDYEFIYVNTKFEQITGLQKKDIINKTVKEILPNTEKIWIDNYGKVAQDQIKLNFTEFSSVFNKYFEVSAYSPEKDYFAVTFNDVSDSIQIFKDLNKKNTILELLESNLENVVWISDNSGLIFVSRAFEKIWGISNEELFNEPEIFLKNIHPDDLNKINRLYKDEISNGVNSNVEYRLIVDGKIKWIWSRSKTRVLPNKNNITLGIATEITDRKNYENKIIENEALLKSVIENIPFDFWARDINRVCILQNNSSKDNWGNLIGNTPQEQGVDPETLELWNKNNDLVYSGETINEEVAYIDKFGKLVYAMNILAPIKSNNDIIGILGLNIDISEQKSIQKKLADSEANLKTILNNTHVAFILMDKNYTILAYNELAKEITYKISKIKLVKDLRFDTIIKKERYRFFQDSFNNAMQGKIINNSAKFEADNEKFYLNYNYYPVIKNDEVVAVCISFLDITQNELNLNKLKESEERNRTILNLIPDLMLFFDENNICFYAKIPESFGKYNISADIFTDKHIENLFPIENPDQFLFEVEEAKKSKTIRKSEFTIIKDGLKLFMDARIISFDVNKLIIIIRDITEAKSIRQKIEEDERFYRNILNNMQDVIIISDMKGIVKYVTPSYYTLVGFSEQEVIGKTIFKNVHKDFMKQIEKKFDKMLKNNSTEVAEYVATKENGENIWLSSIGRVINHDNYNSEVFTVTKDISERKIFEKEQKFLSTTAFEFLKTNDLNKLYDLISQQLYNYLDDSIIMLLEYNKKTDDFNFRSIKGLSKFSDKVFNILQSKIENIKINRMLDKEFFLNQQINEMSIDESAKQLDFKELSHKTILKLKAVLNLDKVYFTGLNIENKLFGTLTIITRNKSSIRNIKVIETFSYIASIAIYRANIEKSLLTAKNKAMESDRLKSAFLANMSHEIRTPMNAILGFTDLLLDADDHKELTEFVNIIKERGEHLLKIINDIIDISKLEAKQINIDKTEFDINQLLVDILYDYKYNLTVQNKNLDVSLTNSKPLQVYSDKTRIRQILTNLLDNAVKFTDKGKVEFGIKKANNKKIHIFVKDEGIGIPKEFQKKIFNRFIQVDHNYHSSKDGTGLGLTICNELVQLLGGSIELKSKENIGSEFIFSFTII